MEKHREIILGIDPGTNITGYGVIEKKGNQYIDLDHGCIKPPSSSNLYQKHLFIHEGVLNLIELYSPSALAIENQFVS